MDNVAGWYGGTMGTIALHLRNWKIKESKITKWWRVLRHYEVQWDNASQQQNKWVA